LAFILSMAFGFNAYAKDKKNTPPEIVYNGLPASWDYYFISPEIMSKYSGDEVSEVCLDDDFVKTPALYETLILYGNRSSRGGLSAPHKYKLLQGGIDFKVIDREVLLVSTPETGVHIVKTKMCKRSVRRAKFIKFSDGIERLKPNRCFKRRRGIRLLTRLKSGVAVCDIVSIHEWNGPFDSDILKAESNNPETDYSDQRSPNQEPNLPTRESMEKSHE